jgi:peptidoglycan/xylan/chitin deacetylase (PgdA/CDA1 family)
MLIVLAILFAQGLSTETTGDAGVPSEPEGRAADLPAERPILGEVDGELRPIGRLHPDEVVLTFDDGPDPTWTPKISDLLEREGVPATFFMVGEHVTRHPELAEDLRARGFELGNHTFTHANLSKVPGWQLDLQMSLTESAIAGATGVRPRLMRPPYSAAEDAVGEGDLDAFERVAEKGYLVSLSTLDSEDWGAPGAAAIVRNSLPPPGRGGVILMHDGGGDRSETLDALGRLIPKLRDRGYRFTTLSQVAGRPSSDVDLEASGSERLRGELLIGSLAVSRVLTEILALLLIPIGLLAVGRAILLVILARRHARAATAPAPGKGDMPPASILVPAYNEEAVIAQSVRSLASSEYPEFEVVVIDDGSTDDTAAIVESLGLPRG